MSAPSGTLTALSGCAAASSGDEALVVEGAIEAAFSAGAAVGRDLRGGILVVVYNVWYDEDRYGRWAQRKVNS